MDNERKHSFYDKWSKTHYEDLTEEEVKALWQEYRKAKYLEYEQYMNREILFLQNRIDLILLQSKLQHLTFYQKMRIFEIVTKISLGI